MKSLSASGGSQAKISVFEKNLSWWVLACILVGIVLGQFLLAFFKRWPT